MEAASKCCLNCFLSKTIDMIFRGEEKPCKFYPENMSAKGEFLQVYCCDKYKPIIVKEVSSKSIESAKKQKQQSPFIVSQLKSLGFKVTEVPMYDDMLSKAVNRAWFLGLCLGSSVGTLLTLIALLIGGAL